MEEIEDKRINIRIKTVPFSLRKFIEEIIADDTKFMAFAESPITALMKANVPIDAAKFTKEDAEHLVLVMGKIHAYVKMNEFRKDVKFEDVFNVTGILGGDSAYVSPKSHSFKWINITPKIYYFRESNLGITPGFKADGLNLEKVGEIFTAPLISPKELNALMASIERNVDAKIS
jgi:hypothetical protein